MDVRRAEAGRRGQDVRSDAWVAIELRDNGGLEINITSKVQTLYGDSIEKMVREGMDFFDIENARIDIEDKGTLPFVLMARIEGAVRRLFPDQDLKAWLPTAGPAFQPSDRRRTRRSRLYLPGNEPKFMINAALHMPDGLILDLEDAVAPSEKDIARIIVRNALVHLDFLQSEKMVRINQGERGLKDLQFVIPYGVNLILVPKIESSEDLMAVDKRIQELKEIHKIEHPIWLMPIIESAKGAWFAYDIACATENVVALSVGLEDYTADIGTQRTLEGRESEWMRGQILNGAKAAGIQAIDTVFSDVSDMNGLRSSVLEAKSYGYEGKGCIHPRQIAIVHEGFAPTEKEIVKAQKITLAYEEATRKGLGAVSLGRKMIDAPVVKRALHTISVAEKEGLVSANWREEQK